MNVGDLFFALRASDRQLQSDVKKAGDKAGTTLGSSITASIKKSFSGQELGRGLVQGLGLAGALGAANLVAGGLQKVTDFIHSSTEAASNLNEVLFLSKSIFGDHADEMEAWAATGADAFGQSKRAALQAASGFAGLFKVAGIELDKAVGMSRQLTELGSDLASAFNTDVETALEAIRSGLAGESEPLRRFNIFLSETAVSSELVALGQKKVNGQWTEAQKQLARYNIILRDSTDAQGVFGADANSLADAQRTATAELENQQAVLGQKWLPIQLAITRAQIDFIEGIGVVDQALGDIGDTFKTVGTIAGPTIEAWTFGFIKTRDAAEDTARGVGQSLKDVTASTGAAADEIGVDARSMHADMAEAGNAWADWGNQSIEAARDVRRASVDSLTAIQALREGITGDAALAASTLFDPIIAEIDALETAEELRAARKALRDKDITDAERRELERRIAELNKSLIEQNALILTFGTEAEQLSKIKAFLASDWWRQAYADATPEQRLALQEWQATLEERAEALENAALAGGRDVRDGFIGELRKGAPGVGAAIRTWDAAADAAFIKARDDARSWGHSTGAAYAAGLRASYGLVNDAAHYVAGGASGAFEASSPPGPESPLHLIDVWGERTIQAWVDGLRSGAKAAKQATIGVAAAAAGGLAFTPPTLGFAGGVPGGMSTRSLAVPAAGAGSPRVQNNYVTVEGLIPYQDPLSIPRQLQRFGEAGLFDHGILSDE